MCSGFSFPLRACFFLLSWLLVAGCDESVKKETTAESAKETAVNAELKADSVSEEAPIRICTELKDEDFVPPAQSALANSKFLQASAIGDTTKLKIKSRKDIDRGPAAAGVSIYLWAPGSRIKVQFLKGNPAVIDKIIRHARVWEQYANIKFEFGTFAAPDITVDFNPVAGSSSYLGLESKVHRPSMNFGWLYPDSSEEEYASVVAHEFGHALGLIHEHMNPQNNPIRWNRPKVYAYYKKNHNWDPSKVDENIFFKYETNQLKGTAFDPKSIMIYAIPKSLTDGYSTAANRSLSAGDIALVQRIYPFTSQ